MQKRWIAGALAAGMLFVGTACSETSTAEEATAEPTEAATATATPEETATPEPTEEPTPEPTEAPDPNTLDQTGTMPGGVTYAYSSAWTPSEPDATPEPGADATEDSINIESAFYGVTNESGTDAAGMISVMYLDMHNMEGNELWDATKFVFINQLASSLGIDKMSQTTDAVTAGTPYIGTGTQSVNGQTMMTMGMTFLVDYDLYQFGMMSTVQDTEYMSKLYAEVVNSAALHGTPFLVTPLAVGDSDESATANSPEPVADVAAAEAPAEPAQDVTTGMRNALGKAESYLSHSGFSESGLRRQLEYEGFTTEEIHYAMANVAVDWNAEAVEKAESYLSHSSLSRDRLLDQLEYEGFTPEQAEQAVAAVYD